jgi:hypothetical protein
MNPVYFVAKNQYTSTKYQINSKSQASKYQHHAKSRQESQNPMFNDQNGLLFGICYLFFSGLS